MSARVTHLPYEAEAHLRKDLHTAHKHIDELMLGGRKNHSVEKAHYLTPQVDVTMLMPKYDEKGELHYYKTVRSVLEYIFEHDGVIKSKYKPLLDKIHAPPHILELMQADVT